jgi:hypothetical protein
MHRMLNTHPKFVAAGEDQILSFQQCNLLMIIGQVMCWRVMETARIEVRDKKVELMNEDGCKSMKTLMAFCGLCGQWA